MATKGKTTKLSDGGDIEPSVAEAKKAIKVNLLTIYQLSNKHAIHLKWEHFYLCVKNNESDHITVRDRTYAQCTLNNTHCRLILQLMV